MAADDLTRRAIIAAHDAECSWQACDGSDISTYAPLSKREQAIVALWRADRDDILKGAAANALTITSRAEKAEAAIERVRDMHRPQRIYDECDHQHEYSDPDHGLPDGVVEVPEIGLTCEDAYVYSVCRQCCTDEDARFITEECSDVHFHGPDETHHCPTMAALDGTEGHR